jgi:hypothetical protein
MDICKAQNIQNPHNIFPENFELQFYQAFHSLKQLGCDYFYFLLDPQVFCDAYGLP